MDDYQPKRCRHEQEYDVNSEFKQFSTDAGLVECTRVELDKLRTADFAFRLLKIQNCNANKEISFSQAYCETLANVKTDYLDGIGQVTTIDAYRISSIFARGINFLKDFLNDPNQIPDGLAEKVALKRLIHTLNNLESINSCLRKVNSRKECDWTLALTQHLLRSLSVNQSFLVDDRCSARNKRCTCCGQAIDGKFGDTSIGCTSVWHGSVDLILGREVLVAIADEEQTLNENELTNEVESYSEFSSLHRQQVIAQTIVFSFLQRKEQTCYDHNLVPCIGISKDYFVIFMYDCEHDVLLESVKIQLMDDRGFFVTEVLVLWLVVNYRFTCSGVTKHMIDSGYKAEFPKHVGAEIETYRRDVEFGCASGRKKNPDMFTSKTYNFVKLH